MKLIFKTAITFFSLFLSFSVQSSHAEYNDCHPKINEAFNQYIIGYGSLIQTQSKKRTYPQTGENLPVVVYGFQRTWNARGFKNQTTYLGIKKNQLSEFNGVIFKLDYPNSIQEYDQREEGYCRILVNQNDVVMMDGSLLPQGEFWVYMPKQEINFEPSYSYPIKQAYVDIFLSGCLEVEDTYHLKDYAIQCIDSTNGWSDSWVNDRAKNNRDPRDKPSVEQIKRVNFILEFKLPLLFNKAIDNTP